VGTGAHYGKRVRQPVAGGWDSRTCLVDGMWIEREPLRPEVEAGLRARAVAVN